MNAAINSQTFSERLSIDQELAAVLNDAPEVLVPANRDELLEIAVDGRDHFQIGYEVAGRGWVHEVDVLRCKNGVSVNYVEPYMRRRDPDCMVIADEGITDKTRYRDRFGQDFASLRKETFEWLRNQKLLIFAFFAGGEPYGYPTLLVAPSNAGFFAGGLADLQGSSNPNVCRRGSPRVRSST